MRTFQEQEDFPGTLQTMGYEIFPRTSCESVATATKTQINDGFNDEFLCVDYIHKSLI